jgi:FkbM family methyltransferase
MNRQLIYDVGAHKGEDTGYYLSLGYRVVAIEADPSLATQMEATFSSEIKAGQCTVVNVGIAEHEGDQPFYVVPEVPVWSSFDRNWATRGGHEVVTVNVKCRRFESILDEYKIPHFLKVDIEGRDYLCLRALSSTAAPDYISFEAEPNSLEMILWLHHIGYRRFILVNQFWFKSVVVPEPGSASHLRWACIQNARRFVRSHPRVHTALAAVKPKLNFNAKAHGFEIGSSGPVPMTRIDGWQDIDAFVYTWTNVLKSGILTSSWYDIHACRS